MTSKIHHPKQKRNQPTNQTSKERAIHQPHYTHTTIQAGSGTKSVKSLKGKPKKMATQHQTPCHADHIRELFVFLCSVPCSGLPFDSVLPAGSSSSPKQQHRLLFSAASSVHAMDGKKRKRTLWSEAVGCFQLLLRSFFSVLFSCFRVAIHAHCVFHSFPLPFLRTTLSLSGRGALISLLRFISRACMPSVTSYPVFLLSHASFLPCCSSCSLCFSSLPSSLSVHHTHTVSLSLSLSLSLICLLCFITRACMPSCSM